VEDLLQTVRMDYMAYSGTPFSSFYFQQNNPVAVTAQPAVVAAPPIPAADEAPVDPYAAYYNNPAYAAYAAYYQQYAQYYQQPVEGTPKEENQG
jgi:hypothetical protein